MMSELLLSNIRDGQSVIVRSIEESKLKVKLMEMGLIEGKRLKVLFRAPFGDPIAFDVEGYVLSLRKDEASLITVEYQSSETP
jgi:Fe2+ transport system protein FeoA